MKNINVCFDWYSHCSHPIRYDTIRYDMAIRRVGRRCFLSLYQIVNWDYPRLQFGCGFRSEKGRNKMGNGRERM